MTPAAIVALLGKVAVAGAAWIVVSIALGLAIGVLISWRRP